MTIRINLDPAERPPFRLDPLVIVLLVMVISSTLSFYYYGQAVEQQTAQLEQEMIAVDKQIRECETARTAVAMERQKMEKLDQQFRLVQSLMHDPLKFANLMAEISQILPDEVTIDSLNIEPATSNLTFSAVAKGPLPLSLIATTIHNLNRSAYFDDAELHQSTRQGDNGNVFSFSMTAHFDPLAAAEKPPGTLDPVAGKP